MWLTSFMAKNIKDNRSASAGSITGSKGSRVQVDSSEQHFNLPVVSPYGVVYVPPIGAQAVLVSTNSGDACVGVLNQNTDTLKQGELMLRSAGGATIVLKNDGRVLINGKELGGA